MLDPHLFEDVQAAFRRLMADRRERGRFYVFTAVVILTGALILALRAAG
jgi:hypothetical protein